MQSLNLQPGLPKKKVFELLRNFNERTVRYELNRIIAEKRMIPPSEAKTVKRLKPSEVNAIMELFAWGGKKKAPGRGLRVLVWMDLF